MTEKKGILQTIKEKNMKLTEETNETAYLEMKNDISFQNRRLHRYPLHKVNIQATDLGNVLSEYENYPFDRYGMSFNIYWNAIWEILPDEVRSDIDLRGSKTDFIVYLTFISLLSIPLVAFRSGQLWGWRIAILITILSWLFTKKILYKLAVTSHANYGGYIESVFDIYRFDLAKKLGLPASLCPNENEKKIWQEYADFLLDNVEPKSAIFRAQVEASDLPLYWDMKGNSLYELGKYDESIKYFDEAIRLNPNYVNAWTNKYLALQALGRTTEADAVLARAIEQKKRTE